MRSTILVLIFCLLFLSGTAIAEKQVVSKLDGTNWTVWDIHRKHSFVSGFFLGSNYVLSNNIQPQDDKYDSDEAIKVFAAYIAPDEKKPKNTFSRTEVKLLLGNQTEDLNIKLYRYAVFEITNVQLVEGLDAFYGNFKNKQIKICDAIYVVKKQIKGASDEEIEAVLQYLRADKDIDKLSYTDKNGTKRWASFP